MFCITLGRGRDLDSASRLTSIQQDVVSNLFDVTFGSTSYNPAGQVLQRTIGTASYIYSPLLANTSYVPDGLNRYSTVGGASFGYDARGNLTSDGSGTGSRGFAYDIENRLSTVTVSGTTALTLSYDPLGRLKQTAAGTTTTQYLYDGDKLTAEYDGSATAPLRRYVNGAGVDEPLVWYEGSTTSDKHWFHTDHQGSIVATSNSLGNITSGTQYVYSPYGEPTSWSGSRFRYTGQIALNDATGVKLYYYKARMYEPAIGRFLQNDPISYQGGMNLYGYVGNDPFNASDPSGLIGIGPMTSGVMYGKSNGDDPDIMRRRYNDRVDQGTMLGDPSSADDVPVPAAPGVATPASSDCSSCNFYDDWPGSYDVWNFALGWTNSNNWPGTGPLASLGAFGGNANLALSELAIGVRTAGTVWYATKVLKGPIASEVARNLPQQLALGAARSGLGDVITRNLGDAPRLIANYGPGEWVKMQYVLRGIDENVVVHYFRNLTTGLNMEFKFK